MPFELLRGNVDGNSFHLGLKRKKISFPSIQNSSVIYPAFNGNDF
jgi:hypothetical protein